MTAPALRVLLVCEDVPAAVLGGLAKHVIALGNALVDAGHAVTLMGRDGVSYDAHADEAGFKGVFITGCGDPTRGWKEQATGAWNPWKRPAMARRIAASIRRLARDFDVVHYHGHLPLVARWVPAGINFLQTRHDQGSECITHVRFKAGKVCAALDASACAGCIHAAPGVLRRAVSGFAVERYRRLTADAFARHPVVFVSEQLRRNYRRAVPEADLRLSSVVHNFVDEAALPPAQPAPSQTVIHVAGRLDAAKGIGDLLDRLIPGLPVGWQVNVFGDGPLRETVQQRHQGPQVEFFGHKLLTEVRIAAAAASACVVPSMCEESCPTVILEALRLGKPCYALRRGGTPELARYGALGQLRLFDTLDALVAQLLRDGAIFQTLQGGEPADVSRVLPMLLTLYRHNLTTRSLAAAAGPAT